MVIEKIQKNTIYLSNDEKIPVSPFIIYSYDLSVGKNIEEEYFDILTDSAYEKAVFLLGFKERTKKDLFLKLRETYPNVDAINLAIDKLEENGLVSDKNYAILYIKSKPYGRNRIVATLMYKGIDKEIIDQAYEEINEEYIEEFSSIDEEKLNNLIKSNLKKSDRKLIESLMRKGFNYNDIIDILRTYKENVETYEMNF